MKSKLNLIHVIDGFFKTWSMIITIIVLKLLDVAQETRFTLKMRDMLMKDCWIMSGGIALWGWPPALVYPLRESISIGEGLLFISQFLVIKRYEIFPSTLKATNQECGLCFSWGRFPQTMQYVDSLLKVVREESLSGIQGWLLDPAKMEDTKWCILCTEGHVDASSIVDRIGYLGVWALSLGVTKSNFMF